MTRHYVSGHLDLTDAEFAEHYEPRIRAGVAAGDWFVVGDARGADQKAQAALKALGHDRVAIYHMFDKPRHNAGFHTYGGYSSDESRDAAMTAFSEEDLAWVRPGREKSGTAKNLARRRVLPRTGILSIPEFDHNRHAAHYWHVVQGAKELSPYVAGVVPPFASCTFASFPVDIPSMRTVVLFDGSFVGTAVDQTSKPIAHVWFDAKQVGTRLINADDTLTLAAIDADWRDPTITGDDNFSRVFYLATAKEIGTDFLWLLDPGILWAIGGTALFEAGTRYTEAEFYQRAKPVWNNPRWASYEGAQEKDKPRRWRRGAEYGCYFPGTDLNVGQMGGRGTGVPPEVEWIDSVDDLPWVRRA